MAKRKVKRIRRAYLKSFSAAMVNTGHSVDWRGQRPHIRDEATPSTRGVAGIHGILNRERQEVQTSLQVTELWQSDFWQGIHLFNAQIIVNLPGKYKIIRYFSGNKNFFVKEDYLLRITERSIQYKDREQAMRFYNLDRITWIECVKSYFPPQPV